MSQRCRCEQIETHKACLHCTLQQQKKYYDGGMIDVAIAEHNPLVNQTKEQLLDNLKFFLADSEGRMCRYLECHNPVMMPAFYVLMFC